VTVPARRPEDQQYQQCVDALDRLLAIVEAAETQGRWILSGRDVINITQAANTVREALERQRVKCVFPACVDGEKPEWCGCCGDALRAESAEAEVRQLREQRDKARRDRARFYLEMRRLTEGLRDLIKEAPEALDQNAVWVDDLLDLLSASPSDGGCEHDYVFQVLNPPWTYLCDKCGTPSFDGVHPRLGSDVLSGGTT
jgi:hypothetical protein